MLSGLAGANHGNSSLHTECLQHFTRYCAEKPTLSGLGETLEEVVELDPGERPDSYRLGTRLAGRLPVHMSLTKATLQKLEPLQSGWAAMQQAVVDRGVQQELLEVALPQPQVGRSDWRPAAGSGHGGVAGSLLQPQTEIKLCWALAAAAAGVSERARMHVEGLLLRLLWGSSMRISSKCSCVPPAWPGRGLQAGGIFCLN